MALMEYCPSSFPHSNQPNSTPTFCYNAMDGYLVFQCEYTGWYYCNYYFGRQYFKIDLPLFFNKPIPPSNQKKSFYHLQLHVSATASDRHLSLQKIPALRTKPLKNMPPDPVPIDTRNPPIDPPPDFPDLLVYINNNQPKLDTSLINFPVASKISLSKSPEKSPIISPNLSAAPPIDASAEPTTNATSVSKTSTNIYIYIYIYRYIRSF